MKVKFIGTTNTSAQPIVGREVELSYNLKAYFRFDSEGLGFDYRHGYFTTSIIKNISIEEISFNCYRITITTNNSEYVFQHGELTDRKPLTKDEKLALSLMLI